MGVIKMLLAKVKAMFAKAKGAVKGAKNATIAAAANASGGLKGKAKKMLAGLQEELFATCGDLSGAYWKRVLMCALGDLKASVAGGINALKTQVGEAKAGLQAEAANAKASYAQGKALANGGAPAPAA